MSTSSLGNSSHPSPASRILGLIPARGGSKRIPRKNVALLDGKPLIAYTIDVALDAVKQGFLDRAIVSTDDEEIAKLSKKLGADVPFMRPKKFADDHSTDLDVCKHAVEELSRQKWVPTAIVILRPTQPLRILADVKDAVQTFTKNGYDSVRSLTRAEHHPYWMKRIKDDGSVVPFVDVGKPDEQLRSQDLPPVYRLNGIVDVISVKNFSSGKLYGGHMGGVVIDPYRSVDLDTPFDFFLAECTLRYLREKKN